MLRNSKRNELAGIGPSRQERQRVLVLLVEKWDLIHRRAITTTRHREAQVVILLTRLSYRQYQPRGTITGRGSRSTKRNCFSHSIASSQPSRSILPLRLTSKLKSVVAPSLRSYRRVQLKTPYSPNIASTRTTFRSITVQILCKTQVVGLADLSTQTVLTQVTCTRRHLQLRHQEQEAAIHPSIVSILKGLHSFHLYRKKHNAARNASRCLILLIVPNRAIIKRVKGHRYRGTRMSRLITWIAVGKLVCNRHIDHHSFKQLQLAALP